MKTVGFDRHDHAGCIAASVAAAERHCQASGLQLTPVRRRVLELLLKRHRALGAYEILDVLRLEGLGSQPPVAYRALDFLVAQGFVHRIEKLNAFVACTHPEASHTPAFLICRLCHAVAETQAQIDSDALGKAAKMTGFEIERTVVEAVGICPNCSEDAQ